MFFHLFLKFLKFYNNAGNITLLLSTNSRTTKDKQVITMIKSFKLDDDFVVLLKQIVHFFNLKTNSSFCNLKQIVHFC